MRSSDSGQRKQKKEQKVKKIAVVKGSIQSGGTSPRGKTKMRMLAVGDAFPAFSMTATVSTNLGKAFRTITDQDYPGKWKVYFFWPKDFTFVCPTEIVGFAE